MERKVDLSPDDSIIRNVENRIRKIQEDQNALYVFKSDPTTYKGIIRAIIYFIRKMDKEAKINIQKYRTIISRKIENKIRKRILDIFKPIIKLLEDEKNIDDENIDYYFVNFRINRFMQKIRSLSEETFTIYMNA